LSVRVIRILRERVGCERGRPARHESSQKLKEKNKQQAKETKEDVGQEMETAHD